MITFLSIIEFINNIYISLTAYLGLKTSIIKLKEKKLSKLESENKLKHKDRVDAFPLLMSYLHKADEIDRVTIFKSHNGDGIPHIATQSYTSCLAEVLTNKTTPIHETWQNIPSDKLMVECIYCMMDQGVASLNVSFCDDGILKDFCQGNNIKSVLAVPITYTDTGFIFLNFCSTSSSDLLESKGILYEAKSCAGRIKELLEK